MVPTADDCEAKSWLDRAVTAVPQLRTAEEIHRYLVDELNSVLRRPAMYGGESALWMVFNHVLHVEGNDHSAWEQEQRGWEVRGVWSTTGVAGAMQKHLPRPAEDAMASIYAETAHRHGWLITDRPLPISDYQAVRAGYRAWASRDRTLSDISEAFGAPSILLGGKNPLYSKTLGYLPISPTEPIIWFHLWNGTDPDAESTWPPSHERPLLLAARESEGPLSRAMVFTPEGERRRPS